MSDVPAPIPFRFDQMLERSLAIAARHMTPIEKAKQLGTFNAADRSKQYPLDHPEKVIEAVNKCWTKVHSLEAENRRKEETIQGLKKQLGRYKFSNIGLISIITGLAWEGLKALITLIR